MQTTVFPDDYNKMVDANTKQKVDEARQHCNGKIQFINSQRYNNPSGQGAELGASIGFCVGFIACIGVCLNFDNPDGGFYTWGATVLISMLIGFVIDKSAKSAYEKNEANAESQIAEENKRLEQEIDNINAAAQKEKAEYRVLFEGNAQKMSVQFAESELAKEVIEWMTEGFCRTIDAADRRSHIEQIIVPFEFNVFYNEITCNLGTFDFELRRCENLNSALKRTALARAIVSAIQLNIVMKYPKDATGTDVSINIFYSYMNQYVKTTIKYVAPNGNYEAVRHW